MNRDERTAEITALLAAEGIPQQRAAELATRIVEQHAGTEPGTVYGHVHPFNILKIWERATFAGVRRMVLELDSESATLAENNDLLTVRVLDAEKWPEWTEEQAAKSSALAGILADLSDVSYLENADQHAQLGWTETDDMAHGEGRKTAAEWEADAARARAEALN